MSSPLEDFVTEVAAQVADATVSFEVGALQINRHGQRRRVIFARRDGRLIFSSSPGREFTAPNAERIRFAREENLQVQVRAESDEAVDALFDRLVNCIFEISGPNAFADSNSYLWLGNQVAVQGTDANLSREPGIGFDLRVRLLARPRPLPAVNITHANATVTEGDTSQTIHVPPP